MIGRRSLLAVLTAIAFAGWNRRALAAEFTEPARGTALRRALLDSLRPHVESEMRTPVEFVVWTMRVANGFAYLVVDPQHPGGRPIDPMQTIHRSDIDFMDGLTVYALLRQVDGRWIVLEHFTGPTDAVFFEWPQMFGAPPSLFGLQ